MYSRSKNWTSSKVPHYVPPEIWKKAPHAYEAPENEPKGNCFQKFFFFKPWEAKHAIGVKHATRLKFEGREGITKISFKVENAGTTFGYFGIHGTPEAVDSVMEDLASLLRNCDSSFYM